MFSSLVRAFTIFIMKVLSLLLSTVLACLVFSVERDIRAGIVLDSKTGSESELGNVKDFGVEAKIDTSEHEASELSGSSSEAQKVQFEIAR